jgi:hypothetical protein
MVTEMTENDLPRSTVPIPDPTLLTTQALTRDIASLRELLESKLEGQKSVLESRLDGIDRANAEQYRSSKDAILKAEIATDKRIEQLGIVISSVDKSLSDKIDDVKQRQTRMEGQGGGMKEMWGYILAAISMVIAVVSFVYNMNSK